MSDTKKILDTEFSEPFVQGMRDRMVVSYYKYAANFAMIEFMHPSVEGAFFAGTDDDQSPGRRVNRTGVVDKRDNSTIGTNPNSKTAAFR